MDIFIRRKMAGDRYPVWYNLNEYFITYNIQFRDFVITAIIDCPQGLEDGQIRLCANTGLKLENIINTLDDLNESQIRMLHHNLHWFMGWLDNSRYKKDVNYVYYARLKTEDKEPPIWTICNIIEVESEESIVQGILNLALMASLAIMDIFNCNIPYIKEQNLLDAQILDRIDVIKEFSKEYKS